MFDENQTDVVETPTVVDGVTPLEAGEVTEDAEKDAAEVEAPAVA